jgi:dynamin GTPase
VQECILDEGPEKENGAEEASVAKSLSKSKKSSVIRTVNEDPGDDLVFQVSHKVSYKTVLKAQHSLILKASNMVEKLEWIAKLRGCIELPKDSYMKSGSVKESKSSGNIAALSPGVSGGHVVQAYQLSGTPCFRKYQLF